MARVTHTPHTARPTLLHHVAHHSTLHPVPLHHTTLCHTPQHMRTPPSEAKRKGHECCVADGSVIQDFTHLIRFPTPPRPDGVWTLPGGAHMQWWSVSARGRIAWLGMGRCTGPQSDGERDGTARVVGSDKGKGWSWNRCRTKVMSPGPCSSPGPLTLASWLLNGGEMGTAMVAGTTHPRWISRPGLMGPSRSSRGRWGIENARLLLLHLHSHSRARACLLYLYLFAFYIDY